MSESTKTTVGLKMAKATEQDMSASVRLASILSDVQKGYYPMAATPAESEDEPLIFDEDDRDHLRVFYDRVMACMNAAPGGLFRVVWGFSTLMSNNVCDPDADVLEFHPRFSERQYPKDLTPELRDVLGMMIMQTCPIAHGFRDAGAAIPPKTEEEQAYVLHWLIGHVLTSGAEWRKAAAADMKDALATLETKKAASSIAASAPKGDGND